MNHSVKLQLKQIAVFILLLAMCTNMLVTASASSSLGSLTYWYSDASYIGRWETSPEISSTKLNSNSDFYYASALATARTQWNDALDLSMTVSSSGAIQFYGGTLEELEELDIWSGLSSSTNGITGNYSRTTEGTYTWGSTSIKGYIYSGAACAVVDNDRTLSRYKKTATHELGHALGYAGHDSSSISVMYESGSDNYTLSSRDKYHLGQVYSSDN